MFNSSKLDGVTIFNKTKSLTSPSCYVLVVISNNYLKIAAVYYLHLGDIYRAKLSFKGKIFNKYFDHITMDH